MNDPASRQDDADEPRRSDTPPPPAPPEPDGPRLTFQAPVPDAPHPSAVPRPAQVEPADRWAHRRAEPRPLALLWTTYLAIATLIMLTSLVAHGGADHEVYRPAARALLAVTAVGLSILWPMMRLSQVPAAEGAAASAAKDMVVIVAPIQAIVWPQMFFVLAHWPFEVVAALATMLSAWGILIGAVLAVATEAIDSAGDRAEPRAGGASRALWMLVFVGLTGIGPAIGVLLRPNAGAPDDQPGAISPWALTSPVASVFEIARDRPWSGQPAEVGRAHWAAIGIVAAVGLVAWAGVAGAASLRRRGARPA